MTRALLPRLAFVALLVFFSGGCVESPATWLPDSTGFCFVHTDGVGIQTVHHYDLAKKAHKLIASVEGKIVSDVAVHPSGETFALVTQVDKKGPVLSIHDMTGKRLHRSDALALPADGQPVALHWFPDGTRLWLGGRQKHGVYDWSKRHLTLKDGGTPWPAALGSPIRPDGAGYVVHRPTEGYVFLDLESWGRRLKEDVDLWVKEKEIPRTPRFHWKEKNLHVHLHGAAVLHADTVRGASERKAFDPRLTAVFEPNPAKGPAAVDVVVLDGDEVALALLQDQGSKTPFQVVAHRFGENKNKVLVPACERVYLLPAPDRKHALILHEKSDGKTALLIVDRDAEVIDVVSLGKSWNSQQWNRVVRGQDADPEPPVKKTAPPIKEEPSYYEVALDSIVVRPTQADGSNWDVFRGYPDIEVQIRNLRAGTSFTSPIAADTLDHAFNVLAGKAAVNDTLEIDVWDKDLSYHDHIGLKRLSLTRAMLDKQDVDLSFGQVSSLRMRFFPLRSAATFKVDPKREELPFADDRVAALFEQIAPSTIGMDRAERRANVDRAIVIIHGLRVQVFDSRKVYRPYLDSWQQPHSLLVRTLFEQGDVYGFSYGQNRRLEHVSSHPELVEGVRRLKKMGYREIVLVGHSAGGLVARQFVEDHPYEGVTQVVQACTPNGGACLAHCTFVIGEKQAPFLGSLIPQSRSLSTSRRDVCLPSQISFTTLVGTYGKCGDGVVSCYSQWPLDLQAQGVPAYAVRVNHHTGMESEELVRKVADVIATRPLRWSTEEVAAGRKVFFE